MTDGKWAGKRQQGGGCEVTMAGVGVKEGWGVTGLVVIVVDVMMVVVMVVVGEEEKKMTGEEGARGGVVVAVAVVVVDEVRCWRLEGMRFEGGCRKGEEG